MAIRTTDYLQSLVREMQRLTSEAEWVEFKKDNIDPQMIGENISAISNSAAILGRPKGYLVWGIDDKTDNSKHNGCRTYQVDRF